MAENHRDPWLTGRLLIAMPHMPDGRFAKTVIYMCAHNEDGAMGLVINRPIEKLTFPELLSQLGIGSDLDLDAIRVHFGGPVETGRGFVLHSAEYERDDTMQVNDDFSLTATVEILRSIAAGDGPRQSLLALGYAGWGPGQLDDEIRDNGWLSVPTDETLLFDTDLDTKWDRALAKLGINPLMLSAEAGRA